MFQSDVDWTPYIEESFRLYYPVVKLHSLISNPSDTLYGEEKNKVYRTYTFPAFIKLNPSEKILTKFGYDVNQDIFLAVPTSVLNTIGVQLKIGDLVEFNGYTYKLTTVKLKQENDWREYIITAVGKLDGS